MNRINNFETFVNESQPWHTSKSEENRYEKLLQLQQERKEKQEELDQMFLDMEGDPDIESEGGPIADKWGKELNKQQEAIDKLDLQIEKMENPATRKKREAGLQTDSKRILLKNIEDVKRSMKAWPDRNVEEQASIYKKRYGISDELTAVVGAIKELQAENKLPE